MDHPTYPQLHAPRTRFGMAVVMLLLACFVQALPLAADFERTLYDLRVRVVSALDRPTPEIVVVEVDDYSLRDVEGTLNLWPWPRYLHGNIVSYLSAAQVIGMDVIYSEEQLARTDMYPGDPALIQAVSSAGNVVLAAFFSGEVSDMVVPEAFARMQIAADQASLQHLPANRHVFAPFHQLLEACGAIGDVSLEQDPDGKTRSYQAVERFQESVYPSLALAVAARSRGVEIGDIRLVDGEVRFGDRSLPLAADGSFRFVPHDAAYPRISAADLIFSHNAELAGLEPEYPREYFRDKIVLLGVTATGVRDEEITSLRTPSHGVLIHADAVDNLLRGVCFRGTSRLVLGGLMVLLALAPAVVRVERPRYLILLAASLLLAFLVPAFGLALARRIMLPTMGPVLAIGLSCTGLGMLSWTQERSRRRYLETLDLAKQQFTDMLVHDLKNTVAPIIMSLTMIGVGKRRSGAHAAADDDFLRKDFPEIVSTSANKLMTQINALLDIRRMQEGRMQLKREICSPHELLQRIDEEYQVPVSRADLQLCIEPASGEECRIRVDPAVFDRILGNMIWNAVKYADQRSAIRVGSRAAADDIVCIYVANRGEPIPEDVQGSLFSAFVTGPDAAQRRGRIPSTGLGLTFCKLAVEAHQGRIELLSPIPGQIDGVEVRLLIPTCSPDPDCTGR